MLLVIPHQILILFLGACPANSRSSFDTLMANGMGIEKIDVFPFVLSPSKHNKGFAGQALRTV